MTELEVTHSKCRCPTCHLYFNSTAAFDKHRTGIHGEARRCMSLTEMLAIGMATNKQGYWVTALMPTDLTYGV